MRVFLLMKATLKLDFILKFKQKKNHKCGTFVLERPYVDVV